MRYVGSSEDAGKESGICLFCCPSRNTRFTFETIRYAETCRVPLPGGSSGFPTSQGSQRFRWWHLLHHGMQLQGFRGVGDLPIKVLRDSEVGDLGWRPIESYLEDVPKKCNRKILSWKAFPLVGKALTQASMPGIWDISRMVSWHFEFVGELVRWSGERSQAPVMDSWFWWCWARSRKWTSGPLISSSQKGWHPKIY